MAWFTGSADRWREILETLARRKLRTALTALSVAWGIFMLVVLLAAGNGLANGAEAEFGGRALNSVFVAPGRLSKAHQGHVVGQRIRLDAEDHARAREALPVVQLSTASVGLGPQPLRRGRLQGTFDVKGVQPDDQLIETQEVVAGRYLNDADERERRKVALIGLKVRDALFPGEDPIGAQIELGRGAFTVVGVVQEEDENSEQRTVTIPLATAQLVWGRGTRIDNFFFTVGEATPAEADASVLALRRMLAERHGFAPEDKQAVRIFNNQEMYTRFRNLFRGIRGFVWIIGLGTILAGVVGVSNIMLISVQERTREIGVRKAIGAPPSSIVAMILQEALAITLVSGYLGLCAGVALVTAAKAALPPAPYFRRPDIDLGVALAATAVLVVAGMLAGLFPALRAARVNPIVAMRVE